MRKNKALPFTIPKTSKSAIIVQRDLEPQFYNQLHQHKEIQLSFIIAGQGNLFAGNSISHFQADEIVVLNSRVPHLFESTGTAEQLSDRISLFFDPQWLEQLIATSPELEPLAYILNRSNTGFKIKVSNPDCLARFKQVLAANKLNRFINLLQLLGELRTPDYELLDSGAQLKPYSLADEERMQRLLRFTLENYSEQISLAQAASQTALTPTAFCKYFKKRTGKSYMAFLNQLRIEASCRELQENPQTNIAQIAYNCGFNSLANFNRQFKKIKKTTPRSYKNTITG